VAVAPVLTGLTPQTAPLGSPSFTLHVSGNGFRPGAVIEFAGNDEPTVYVSATEVTGMPMKPERRCSYTGCGSLATCEGRCAAHRRDAWHAGESRRMRGGNLQRARDRLFAASPLCALCLEAGRTTLATIRDHVTNLAEGGTEHESNTQALCVECSDSKTRSEARRGRIRARLSVR
jgi:5-methylcytosine-specific restriction protein A